MSTESLEIPEDITPKAFYEELLPQMLSANRDRAEQAVGAAIGIEASLRAEVQGDGGGTWTLRFAGGQLEVAAEALPDPLVTFVQSRDDWQVSITKGIGRLLSKLGSGPSKPAAPGAMRPSLSPAKIEKLKALKGVLNFNLTGYEGDRTICLKTIMNDAQEGQSPTCTMSMGADVYADVASGKLLPQQAFMGGKIQFQGDMGFAMQLFTVLMAPS